MSCPYVEKDQEFLQKHVIAMDNEKKTEIVRKFSDSGVIMTSHGFDRVITHNLNTDEVLKVAGDRRVWLITDEFLTEFVNGFRKIQTLEQKEELNPENLTVKIERTKQVFAKEIDSELRIHEDTDVTGRSTCEGKLADFFEYFNQKYELLREILRNRENLLGTVPINVAKKRSNEDTKIIAMVKDKRNSRKGFKFLDVEDPTGEISILIPQDNSQLNEIYNKIILDEVIGIHGRIKNDLLIATEIAEPELPIDHRNIYAEEPVHAAFISDIHVGSYLFLEKEFNNFINWLNLNGNRSEISEKIKYIVVAGDLVDGIGIYPKQEKELAIPDIYKQYDFLATLLERIPEYIEIILAMGNHDAVRNAEPQPRLEKDIGGRLYDLPNVHITGNPIMLSLHGVKTLVYHGTSIDAIVGNIPGCTYSRPEIAMVEYLKKRYLIPMYGNNQISPERKDYLAIKEIPDILHAGHVHTNGYTNYRGVRVINSGTWQGRTKYQEELGHIPTPCRVPIINLQNHEVSMLHFD